MLSLLCLRISGFSNTLRDVGCALDLGFGQKYFAGTIVCSRSCHGCHACGRGRGAGWGGNLPAEDHSATGNSSGHTIPTSGIDQVYVCAHDGLPLAGLFPGCTSRGVVLKTSTSSSEPETLNLYY